MSIPQWFALAGGIDRHTLLAWAILRCLIPRQNSNGIQYPSLHCLPQRIHVESHPYHGVKKDSIRVRFLQSKQVVAVARFAVACGA